MLADVGGIFQIAGDLVKVADMVFTVAVHSD